MVIVTDLTLNTFYKLHTGENKEDPMIASPFYDNNCTRLFENDIIEHTDKSYLGKSEKLIYAVKLDAEEGWVLHNVLRDYNSVMWKWRIARNSNYPPHKMAIEGTKIGDIFSTPNIIPNAIKEYEAQKEAEKREKELQCLMKLKAKYENPEKCESEA
jgi:hypothetical protein